MLAFVLSATLHVPPVVASVRVVVVPVQSIGVPDIAATVGLPTTVTEVVATLVPHVPVTE